MRGMMGTREIRVGTWGIRVGMRESRWECGDQSGNVGIQGGNGANQGGNAGNQGGNALSRMGIRGIREGMRGIEWNGNWKKWKKSYKIQFSFPEIEKKKLKRNPNCHKTFIFVLSNEKHKASLPGSHVTFQSQWPKPRYYLNEMWTCGPPVMIVILLMKKLHFTQGCWLPRDFELNINCNRFKL